MVIVLLSRKSIALSKATKIIQEVEIYKGRYRCYPMYFKDAQLTDTTCRVGFVKYVFLYNNYNKDKYRLSFIINEDNRFVYFSRTRQWYKSD